MENDCDLKATLSCAVQNVKFSPKVSAGTAVDLCLCNVQPLSLSFDLDSTGGYSSSQC